MSKEVSNLIRYTSITGRKSKEEMKDLLVNTTDKDFRDAIVAGYKDSNTALVAGYKIQNMKDRPIELSDLPLDTDFSGNYYNGFGLDKKPLEVTENSVINRQIEMTKKVVEKTAANTPTFITPNIKHDYTNPLEVFGAAKNHYANGWDNSKVLREVKHNDLEVHKSAVEVSRISREKSDEISMLYPKVTNQFVTKNHGLTR